jgi:hypothetical protein
VGNAAALVVVVVSVDAGVGVSVALGVGVAASVVGVGLATTVTPPRAVLGGGSVALAASSVVPLSLLTSKAAFALLFALEMTDFDTSCPT